MEYAKDKIRVNSINPGTINTPLVSRMFKDRNSSAEIVGTKYPMGRIGEIDEIADVVIFLASDKASFITGQSITVDGGILAQGGWASKA